MPKLTFAYNGRQRIRVINLSRQTRNQGRGGARAACNACACMQCSAVRAVRAVRACNDKGAISRYLSDTYANASGSILYLYKRMKARRCKISFWLTIFKFFFMNFFQ